MDFVEVTAFQTEQDADLAASRLRAEGIPSTVSKDDAGGMAPHLQLSRTVRLLVPPDRLKDARRALKLDSR